MAIVAAYVVVKDNELLLEAATPDQAFDLFDAPDADLGISAVLICRLRPNTLQGNIRLRVRLNGQIVGDDFLFDSVKATWDEVIESGSLRELGNELRVELLSLDGSAAPPGSYLGLSNVALWYSIQI